MFPASLALTALLFATAAHAQPPKPTRLGLCAACHGENGVANVKGVPHLAAQDRDYLAAAMRAAAGALSDRDIDELADWYAAQPRDAGAAR